MKVAISGTVTADVTIELSDDLQPGTDEFKTAVADAFGVAVLPCEVQSIDFVNGEAWNE